MAIHHDVNTASPQRVAIWRLSCMIWIAGAPFIQPPRLSAFSANYVYTRDMRILVVEDEHKIARALAKALEQETHAVDIAYDGDEGYAMATTEPYDIAIIDRMLPGGIRRHRHREGNA